MNNSNKKIFFLSGLLVIALLMITGVTFALWQITLKQESTNVITTGCFKIEFQDENPISLSNAFPITDEEGKKLIPYTFTITNTCDSYASYQINLEVLNDTTLESLDYLKIMFEDNIDLLNKKETVSKTLENATTSKKLETGYLDINGSKTYHLRLWMSENTPTDEAFMNKIFNSKVTIIATYQTEFDYDKPIAIINATKENGSLIIDASASTDNTSIKNYYYSIDGENWISSKNNTHEFQEDRKIEYGTGTSAITSLYNSTIHKVYLKVEDEYGNMSEIVSTDFLDELEYDDTSDNNLRYIGSNPNNYVSFNNELWRIIGVMNNIEDGEGKKETRMKLIRDESIGEYSWDTSIGTPTSAQEGINAGKGVNEWSQSKIKTMLNEYYYNQMSNQTCYKGQYNETITCDFSSNGLTENAKKLIKNTLWYVGSNGNQAEWQEILSAQFYQFERSDNIGKICSNESVYCTDNVTRTTKWIGKVGLMYPSDYGYATAGGPRVNRSSCLSTVLYNWNLESVEECRNNDWLFRPGKNQWTMMPRATSNTSYGLFFLDENGLMHGNLGATPYQILPTVFLDANVLIANGLGTKEQPFELSL